MSELLNKIKEENKGKNCYGCKHRGQVPGSAHSSCSHPVISSIQAKAGFFDALLWFSMVGTNTNPVGITLNVKDDNGDEIDSSLPIMEWNEVGIRNGYVQYPYNFDPTWLVYCLMREEVGNE